MDKIKPKIITIVGPTASGKSDLAIKLAQKFNGEIISADSRQIYKGMDIGTGKVTKREQGLIPHHLIDVANPKRVFSVAQFQKLAQRAIKDILKRNKLPIIVGGTGQYIDTLVYNFALPEVPPNYKLRAELGKQTTEQLFARLQKLDPDRAKTIDSKNKVRLIRALEIIASLGKVPPLNTRPLPLNTKFEVLWLGLNPKDLQKRIAKRLDQRFRQGMIAEVKKLRRPPAGGGISWQRLYDLGLEYRWIGQYLQNKITKEEMYLGLNQAINQYSKRQMTWFKRNKEIHWLALSKIKGLAKPAEAMRLGRAFLKSQPPVPCPD